MYHHYMQYIEYLAEARNNQPLVAVYGLSLDPGTGNFSSGGGGGSVWGFAEQVLSSTNII